MTFFQNKHNVLCLDDVGKDNGSSIFFFLHLLFNIDACFPFSSYNSFPLQLSEGFRKPASDSIETVSRLDILCRNFGCQEKELYVKRYIIFKRLEIEDIFNYLQRFGCITPLFLCRHHRID